jgi:1,2-phenylacetyl-CoA epoxidase catalytic subunit
MSRARSVGNLWFDVHRNHEKASAEQLELLAVAEDISLDDLLDEGLSQGEVILRSRQALGEGVIPPEVLERKRIAREFYLHQPNCRICSTLDQDCDDKITRHHFVPRWMMLELENYTAYSSRSKCTIPICIGTHRDLHIRGDESDKSIAQFMTDDERRFAQKMLDELKDQHPKMFDLLLGGDESSYEYTLIRDYTLGRFSETSSQSERKAQTEKWGLFQAIG